MGHSIQGEEGEVEQMNDVTVCPICGGSVRHVHEDRTITLGSRHVEVADEFGRCESCNETFHDPDRSMAVQREAADRIRVEEGLLMPSEIIAIRESLGLTQTTFEKLLGVGVKTVVRWERGTVFQSKGIDSLLRSVGSVAGVAIHPASRRLR